MTRDYSVLRRLLRILTLTVVGERILNLTVVGVRCTRWEGTEVGDPKDKNFTIQKRFITPEGIVYFGPRFGAVHKVLSLDGSFRRFLFYDTMTGGLDSLVTFLWSATWLRSAALPETMVFVKLLVSKRLWKKCHAVTHLYWPIHLMSFFLWTLDEDRTDFSVRTSKPRERVEYTFYYLKSTIHSKKI